MVKRKLKGLILNLIPSNKTKEERKVIIRKVIRQLGTSSLNTKISKYDGKSNPGVFYDTNDRVLFIEEIKYYLDRLPKRENTTLTQGKLEGKLKEEKLPSKTPKTSKKYKESSSPPPKEFHIKEACEYLKKTYDIKISQQDLKKIMQGGLLTRQSIDDAYRFKMFETIPTILVRSNFRGYEVTVNNKKGVPRYFCERKKVLSELSKEDN